MECSYYAYQKLTHRQQIKPRHNFSALLAGMHDDRGQLQARRQRSDALSNYRILPRPGPKLYTGVIWWAFGLYALFVARAPYTPTPEEEQLYSNKMQEAVFSPEMRDAQKEFFAAQRSLDEVHVWGWRWREPYSRLVPPRQAEVNFARQKLDMVLQERDALQSEAKAAVGLWSQYGVDEVRERFWKAYESGKDFAKRMTWWDIVFGVGGRGNRDEELLGTLLRWLGQIMMNFTVGLVSALFSFGFALVSSACRARLRFPLCPTAPTDVSRLTTLPPWPCRVPPPRAVIWEYKASYLSGFLFFVVAMSGASAMVATFVGGMYATAAGGVYMVIKSAQNHERLEGRRQRAPQYVRHNNYAHYD